MTQLQARRPQNVGVFLNRTGQAGVDFRSGCAELFGRLFVADGIEQARALLAQQQVDLLVIDLACFERGADLDALGRLVAERAGAPTLALCPFARADWLAGLMACGALDYAIAPIELDDLRTLVGASLQDGAQAAGRSASASEAELRCFLALRSRMQQAVGEVVDDVPRLAEQLCRAWCDWPGVLHASMICPDAAGQLQLEGQYSACGLELAQVLGGGDPLRAALPGLIAAYSGETVLLDAPEKGGVPELAAALGRHGIEMALGLPIRALGPGAPRGALCLLFERRQQFSRDQLLTLADLAQHAGVGLRMVEMNRESEQLLARLLHTATIDPLTRVVNRRHGEELLEQEVRRARRYHLPLALIAFDIDRFKAVNERYGYPCGDVALQMVAEAAQAVLRGTDVLIRTGGKEFLILAPHTSAIDGLKVAEKVRLAIAQTPIPGCGQLTVSLGVAQLGEQENSDALALRVGAALARAKRGGRNCVELAMH